MPEMTLGAVIFSSVFALAFSGAAMWMMERKARVLRRHIAPFSQSFLAGCVTFSGVYVLDRLAFPAWPKTTAFLNLITLAGLFAFRTLRKKLRRQYRRRQLPKIGKKRRLSAEAEAYERMLEQDPLNAFCHEKLSELYEALGERDKALEAAREAVRLDRTMKNEWRVEDLEKTAGERKRR